MSIETRIVCGKDIAPYINDLARLRMEVFREYPYLYDGSEDYERRYLETYSASPGAMAVLVFDGDRVIGASTGVPMADETPAFQAPFQARNINTDQLFYCGESVLLPTYRGRGVYRKFFEGREKHAIEQGMQMTCFCAVVRDEKDARKPPGYEPLDPIWRRYGYRPDPNLVAYFPWKEPGTPHDVQHPMMFWLKRL